MKVFVYGTLKQGHANDWLMERVGAQRLGPASLFGYALVSMGSQCPGLVEYQNGETVGELYEVHPDMIGSIDFFESQAYNRIKVKVQTEKGFVDASTYLLGFRPRLEPIGERVGALLVSEWKGR